MTGFGFSIGEPASKTPAKADSPAVKELSAAVGHARAGHGNKACQHAAEALWALCEEHGLSIYEYVRIT